MNKVRTRISIIVAILTICSTSLLAQSQDTDFMRSLGHIYVVIAVIVAIFLGIVVFLIYLDRRLTKLEKEI